MEVSPFLSKVLLKKEKGKLKEEGESPSLLSREREVRWWCVLSAGEFGGRRKAVGREKQERE